MVPFLSILSSNLHSCRKLLNFQNQVWNPIILGNTDIFMVYSNNHYLLIITKERESKFISYVGFISASFKVIIIRALPLSHFVCYISLSWVQFANHNLENSTKIIIRFGHALVLLNSSSTIFVSFLFLEFPESDP